MRQLCCFSPNALPVGPPLAPPATAVVVREPLPPDWKPSTDFAPLAVQVAAPLQPFLQPPGQQEPLPPPVITGSSIFHCTVHNTGPLGLNLLPVSGNIGLKVSGFAGPDGRNELQAQGVMVGDVIYSIDGAPTSSLPSAQIAVFLQTSSHRPLFISFQR